MSNATKRLLEFGAFRVDPEQRLLFRNEQTVPISPKAFDLLLVLVQRKAIGFPGRTISILPDGDPMEGTLLG